MRTRGGWVRRVVLVLGVLPLSAWAANAELSADARVRLRQWQRQFAHHAEKDDLGMLGQAATSVEDILTAMGIDPATVSSPSITGHQNQFAALPGLGSLIPTQGSNFAFLSTGVVGAGTPQSLDPSAWGTESGTNMGGSCSSGIGYDCVFLKFSFVVPADMHSIQFDFNFMSVEYPEFVNLGFNDEFSVQVQSPSYNYANIVFDINGNPINIDSAFFNQPCNSLENTGFDIYSGGSCDAGATGLLVTQAPVVPGETVTLTFSIRDRGDGIYDSAVLVDNFQLSEEYVEGPTTAGQVQIDYLSPKSGPVAGGTQVQIHGDGYINVQAVSFGTVPALFQVIDEETIVAVTPPHSVGPVDVAVTASPSGTASTGVRAGAYTYYVHPEDAPLQVLSVDPPEGPAIGGVQVTVRGSGFDLGTVISFDGVAVPAQQFINGDEIVVTTPRGSGSVEVRATNTDSATSALDGGYLYLGRADDGGFGSSSCSCRLTGTAEERAPLAAATIAVSALALAAWWSRRREAAAPAVRAVTAGGLRTAGAVSSLLLLGGCNDTLLAPVNSAPVANAGPSAEAFAGSPIQLDGSGSYDFEDGETITYAWEIVTRPEGSNAQLDDPSAESPSFIADQAGLYRIGLVVTDTDETDSGEIGYGGRDDDNLTDIVVLPFRDLRVTLNWDTDMSDLDLHLIRNNIYGYWTTDDCYYGVPDPEWGAEGIRADNPLLEADIDTGFGPEVISLASPQDTGIYSIVVHTFNNHGAGATTATVKVELNGDLLAELTTPTPLIGTDSAWVVGTLEWPSSAFEEVNLLTTHETLGGPPH